jgi:hypothetical protein
MLDLLELHKLLIPFSFVFRSAPQQFETADHASLVANSGCFAAIHSDGLPRQSRNVVLLGRGRDIPPELVADVDRCSPIWSIFDRCCMFLHDWQMLLRRRRHIELH